MDLSKSNQVLVPLSDNRALHARIRSGATPTLFAPSRKVAKTFWEFYALSIDNENTRMVYLRAAMRFSDWCEQRGIEFIDVEPIHVRLFVEELKTLVSIPTVKLHITALRQLFNYLIVRQHMAINPASAVASPKHKISEGKTPILTPEEMHMLFDSIEPTNLVALRDRAMIAVMAYSFARVSAVCSLDVKDYYVQSKRAFFILQEKGGTVNKVPAHRVAQEYIELYMEAAGIGDEQDAPLFRAMKTGSSTELSSRRARPHNLLSMVKRRCALAGLPSAICNHSFRGTGITTYMLNGGTLEVAAQIAGHANTTTTQLYDRRDSEVAIDEIERILY